MANNDGNIVKRTSQYIDNIGFDENTGLPMVELAGTNGSAISAASIMQIHEFSGSPNTLTGILDVSQSTGNNATTNTTTSGLQPSVTTTNPADLLFSIVFLSASGGSIPSWTGAAG